MGRITSTYTYVLLPVSRSAYEEIAGKLRAAGYDHVFESNEGRVVIDMHGLGLVIEGAPDEC